MVEEGDLAVAVRPSVGEQEGARRTDRTPAGSSRRGGTGAPLGQRVHARHLDAVVAEGGQGRACLLIGDDQQQVWLGRADEERLAIAGGSASGHGRLDAAPLRCFLPSGSGVITGQFEISGQPAGSIVVELLDRFGISIGRGFQEYRICAAVPAKDVESNREDTLQRSDQFPPLS